MFNGNMMGISFPVERKRELFYCIQEIPTQIPNEFVGIDQRLWESLTARLRESPQLSKVFPYLFMRIGFECGNILKEFHKHDISWGTYEDEFSAGVWHCNAHSNNFVFLNNNTDQLLSYLDLDMAFLRSDYIGADFDNIVMRELVYLMETLVTDDTSTGIPAHRN